MKTIRLIDSTLRDGMHVVSNRFTIDDVVEIASALDKTGIDTIEVSHGDGIGASSHHYGFAAATDQEYIKAAADTVKQTKIAVLLLPGVGSFKDMEIAAKAGASTIRIATHVTEASMAFQYIKTARDLGLETIGFLMMSHLADPETIATQAKLLEDYGAQGVYVTDSAGAMLPNQVARRIEATKNAVSIPVGHHAHNNMGLAIANSLKAVEAGADMIDGCCKGLGASAGNAMLEVINAVLTKAGYDTGLDLFKTMDVSDDVIAPMINKSFGIDKNTLSVGFAGTYGEFIKSSISASEEYGVDYRDILIKMGLRKAVSGQKHLIPEIASELKKRKGNK